MGEPKGAIEGDRSFAEGGTRMEIQCSCQDRATLPHHADFSSFFVGFFN